MHELHTDKMEQHHQRCQYYVVQLVVVVRHSKVVVEDWKYETRKPFEIAGVVGLEPN